MSEYVVANNPYSNGLMLIDELNSYCEKCKKENRNETLIVNDINFRTLT